MEIKMHRKKISSTFLFLCALHLGGVVHADEPNVTFYEISGDSAKILRKQLDEKRPKDSAGERFDALTKNRLSYTYRYAPTPNGCKFTEFTPILETTIIMPHWADGDSTSKLGKKWQSYYQALYNHELGHRDIAMNSYKELVEIGRNFMTPKKCDAIGEEFKIVYASTLEKYKQLDQQYDLETDHGKKLGAIFP